MKDILLGALIMMAVTIVIAVLFSILALALGGHL